MHAESKMWDERIMEAEGGVQFSLGEHRQLSGCREVLQTISSPVLVGEI